MFAIHRLKKVLSIVENVWSLLINWILIKYCSWNIKNFASNYWISFQVICAAWYKDGFNGIISNYRRSLTLKWCAIRTDRNRINSNPRQFCARVTAKIMTPYPHPTGRKIIIKVGRPGPRAVFARFHSRDGFRNKIEPSLRIPGITRRAPREGSFFLSLSTFPSLHSTHFNPSFKKFFLLLVNWPSFVWPGSRGVGKGWKPPPGIFSPLQRGFCCSHIAHSWLASGGGRGGNS